MIRRRSSIVSALLVATAFAAVTASPAAATSTDLLGGHGNFEKPVVVGAIIKPFAAGTTFDGWQVSVSTVSLFRAFNGVIVPPQGKQGLVLVNAKTPPGPSTTKAGMVCRAIASVAKHRYSVTFEAATVNNDVARIVAKLGTA